LILLLAPIAWAGGEYRHTDECVKPAALIMVFAIERILEYPQLPVFFDSSWIAFSQNP